MKNEPDKIWKLVKNILLFVPLCGLVAGFFYHMAILNQNREKISPEIECEYKRLTFQPNDSYKFIIENVGLIKCKNMWVNEEIFLIIDGEVYRGDGIPHFNYFDYNGSKTHMWNLNKGEKREIDLVDFQIEAFNRIKQLTPKSHLYY